MSSSSDTGVSDTLDPLAIVSDDEIMSESEVYTSDTTSTDEDDFQPFALPDFGDDIPIADGPFDGDLPLLQVPAPLSLAAVPLDDLPPDEFADDDVDLFLEGPPEGDQDGVALMDADVPFADDPVVDPVVPLAEIPADVPIADPVIPVEAPIEEAPFDLFGAHSFESVVSISSHAQGVQPYSSDSDSDMAMSAAPLVFLDDDPKPEVEFFPDEPAPVGPEPVVAHDPIEAPVDDDYPPFVLPVTPPIASVSAPTEFPLFHPHTTDVHRTNLSITFLQDKPPPRPGEGSSRQPPVSVPPVPSSVPFMSQFPHTASSFIPSGEPFLWASPNVMPLSDPYHPYHVGYTTEDILISLQLQQDALSRRIQELEGAPRPPCHCQTPFAAPHTPRPLSPDSDVRFLTSEQQIAYLLCVIRALEEDWVHMRQLLFSRFPPPPPSA
ncbi:hypothetical protein HanRHA438_Chr04g0173791 [Helianthus annuus]|uniref:Uncharacterized protein n=1 Tax=Helianthus annuus TaxID=4232 RepID=A0A9K3NSP9_HELAN|nr:hypothetical protein HanXRQr2_Chr04g0164031 [Helianthus annuus]KAJ0580904.1 hypothetical protein HanHA300_Chr04g0134751 [Helianthus annuus]KAJ0926657.1 hypothetical protein HanRHA438_Chr04g0173791 [Helianthus annuus]KAJ0931137.1 hypothetical protein HanPSC8_Chr04g0157971 [Helianthus annuus]